MKKTFNDNQTSLTSKQKEVLIFIKQFAAKNKYPPSVRQICKAMDLKSPATVHVHINHLINKGLLKRGEQGNHLLELLVPNEYDVKSDEVINVPLVKKENYNNTLEVIENTLEFFPLPSYLIPKKKEVFTIVANGNDMINANIFDNDMVIIERCKNIKNGDIVVAITENSETILRKLFKDGEKYILQAENNEIEDIVVNKIIILGKAIGLYRKF